MSRWARMTSSLSRYYFQTTGTLGDSYICACKLAGFRRRHPQAQIFVNHTIEGDGSERLEHLWGRSIRQILECCPGVEKTRVSAELGAASKISSYPEDPHDPSGVEMDYFPGFPALEGQAEHALHLPEPYGVICCHSGKPEGEGRNTKLLSADLIRREACRLIEDGAARQVVLLGTDDRYRGIRTSDLIINMVGKTSLVEAMGIARAASDFSGPEGLLAFCALSGLTISRIFYTSREAVEKRIVGTPWERPAELVPCTLSTGWIIELTGEKP